MAGIGRCSHELICSVRVVDPRVDNVALVHVKNSRSPGLETNTPHAPGLFGCGLTFPFYDVFPINPSKWIHFHREFRPTSILDLF
eukprot:COSAG06_NODE_442_length_15715_cov_16.651639_7_plen_85_part_00